MIHQPLGGAQGQAAGESPCRRSNPQQRVCTGSRIDKTRHSLLCKMRHHWQSCNGRHGLKIRALLPSHAYNRRHGWSKHTFVILAHAGTASFSRTDNTGSPRQKEFRALSKKSFVCRYWDSGKWNSPSQADPEWLPGRIHWQVNGTDDNGHRQRLLHGSSRSCRIWYCGCSHQQAYSGTCKLQWFIASLLG